MLFWQRQLDRFSLFLGKLSAALMLLMLLNVFYDVVARYFFKSSSIGMQELEWHFFSSMFMLGIAYTLHAEGHVRVDIFYEKWSEKTRAIVDIVGVVVFLLPFCGLILWYGHGFALESFRLGETSGDPGGLPYRWIIKSMIPASACCLALSGIGLLLKDLIKLSQSS